ncbi:MULTISPECIES: SCO family protein [Exiguobacterium]|uniref:SCO family protein n=1 Tax=Exiguobacterium alkaliphilum TaxID=1428684 RepID=A0ABT2KU32_9BACL|nr:MULTISPECIES: SCO family protein [Exiguobacterium]MCT4794494.1 SCO family protein [Exiguobacterium alkaliphilum]QUE85749.1 SCO family protein [Exiguobacterium alkaliphilum]
MKRNSYMTVGLTVAVLITIGVASYFLFFKQDDLPVIQEPTPFTLTNALDGETYNSDNGKVKVITFFYTNCPDICPLTLRDFMKLEQELKADGLYGTDVELVAITVDPEVDTVPVLENYGAAFQAEPTGWKVLTGEKADIDRITRQLQFYYSKANSGLVTHATTMYIVDRQHDVRAVAQMATTGDQPVDIESIMEDVNVLVAEKE